MKPVFGVRRQYCFNIQTERIVKHVVNRLEEGTNNLGLKIEEKKIEVYDHGRPKKSGAKKFDSSVGKWSKT